MVVSGVALGDEVVPVTLLIEVGSEIHKYLVEPPQAEGNESQAHQSIQNHENTMLPVAPEEVYGLLAVDHLLVNRVAVSARAPGRIQGRQQKSKDGNGEGDENRRAAK